MYKKRKPGSQLLEICLPNKINIFMRIPLFLKDDLEHIVIVDSKKFLIYWGNCPYLKNDKKVWKKDKKYLDIEKIFLNSKNFPVDPPIVGDFIDGQFKIVDGITRILWLISNNAPYFPLSCSHYSKEILNKLTGYKILDPK